jgi:uncharacterized membrane protein YeaQ/YmgE (transglycosylase-associated protein family)
MLHWLWMAIVGLIIGAVAKLIMPGKDPGGIIITMLLGIAGAFLGGWLSGIIGWSGQGGFGWFVMAVIGAIILLAIYRLIKRSTA